MIYLVIILKLLFLGKEEKLQKILRCTLLTVLVFTCIILFVDLNIAKTIFWYDLNCTERNKAIFPKKGITLFQVRKKYPLGCLRVNRNKPQVIQSLRIPFLPNESKNFAPTTLIVGACGNIIYIKWEKAKQSYYQRLCLQ